MEVGATGAPGLYSDRYLKAPLPVLLMLQTMAALRDLLATKGATLPLDIVTEPLRNDPNAPAPSMAWHNWKDEDLRADTIIELAKRFHFDCDYDDENAPHSRTMSLTYEDGTTAILLFDQGFGAWRSRIPLRHEFRAGPQAQSRAILEVSGMVAAEEGSYLAVTR